MYSENMRTTKTVEVLLSTYNGSAYIKEQIDSVIQQKGVDIDLMIRDDGSKDSTAAIIKKMLEENANISLIEGENVGVKNSFYQLILKADSTKDYYAYCDQDDFWEKNKLIKAVEKLEELDNNEPCLYYSKVNRVGSNLEIISNPFKKFYHTENFFQMLAVANATGCTMVFNRALLKKLRRGIPSIKILHDEWTVFVCAYNEGNIIFDKNSYIKYRQHSGNTVAGLEKMELSGINLFVYRAHKFFDFDRKISEICRELVKIYGKSSDKKKRRVIELFINKSFSSRCHILWDLFLRKYGSQYCLYWLKLIIQVAIGKY